MLGFKVNGSAIAVMIILPVMDSIACYGQDGRSMTIIVGLPFFMISSLICAGVFVAAIKRSRSPADLIVVSLAFVMMSPRWMPAAAAGLLDSTWTTTTPLSCE